MQIFEKNAALKSLLDKKYAAFLAYHRVENETKIRFFKYQILKISVIKLVYVKNM